jgi:hypothetical protein
VICKPEVMGEAAEKSRRRFALRIRKSHGRQ